MGHKFNPNHYEKIIYAGMQDKALQRGDWVLVSLIDTDDVIVPEQNDIPTTEAFNDVEADKTDFYQEFVG